MTAYLFLPTRVKPPFQTVAFLSQRPRTRRLLERKASEDMKFFDYVISAAGARYYIRFTKARTNARLQSRDRTPRLGVRRSSKIRKISAARSTTWKPRPDIDSQCFVYMGESMGAAFGVIFAGVEDRFKAVHIHRWRILHRR